MHCMKIAVSMDARFVEILAKATISVACGEPRLNPEPPPLQVAPSPLRDGSRPD